MKMANRFLIFLVYQLIFIKTQAVDITPKVDCFNSLIDSNCQLKMTEESIQQIDSALSNSKTRFVRLNPIVRPYYSDEFWRTKNSSDEIGKYFWVWADGNIGRRFLSLDYNFVEMSLWTLSPGVEKISIDLLEVKRGCWVTLNVTGQFCTLASLFFHIIHEKAVTNRHLHDSTFCYNTQLSRYQCSNVFNISKLNFSLETTRLSNLNTSCFIIIAISLYFLPWFFVLLFPKLLTVRYSQKLRNNMSKLEVNYPTTKTPLSDFFTLRNPYYAIVVVFCQYNLVFNIPLLYQIYINLRFYPDQSELLFWHIFLVLFLFVIGLSLLVLMWDKKLRFVYEFEEYKETVNKYANIKSRSLRVLLGLQSKGPNIDCVISSYFGDYISLENNLRKNWLDVIELIKGWTELILKSICMPLREKSCVKCCTVAKIIRSLIIGLPLTFIFSSPLICVLADCIIMAFTGKLFLILLFQMISLISLILSIAFLSLTSLILVLTMTLAGAIINYEIVLPHIILGLSVLFYVWQPFHDLQEKYRVLKTIAFKECSSSGPKYIKHVQFNAQNADSTHSHTIANTEQTHDGEEESADSDSAGSIQSSTLGLDNDNLFESTSSLRSGNNPGPQHYSSLTFLHLRSDDEGIAYEGNVQALSPLPEQGSAQCAEYVCLYKSDKIGWESIPKDLWESIYKQLLPLDAGTAKASIKSVAAIAMAFFFMGTLRDFDIAWELQFIGQGVASLITVSIPRLVLDFVNTECSRENLKRSWKVSVREIVKKYIKDNEIPDPRSVE